MYFFKIDKYISKLYNMNYIREDFNRHLVFISKDSFIQNQIIKKDLRKYIKSILDDHRLNSIVSIGGESYLFGITSKNIIYISNYTNSKSIYNDVNYNNQYYKKKLYNYHINYNTCLDIISGPILIINLAKLNINLLKLINNRLYQKIIIINCHHDEFWKRISILSNYKLKSRKQFISNKYFVTVNILIYKNEFPEFISLGTTCATAYQLNKLGLRQHSYPFDWAKIDINKLNLVLKNNFLEFENIKIKKLSDNHNYKNTNDEFISESSSYILSNKYNITFAHEVTNIDKLDYFKNKLLIRTNRLLSRRDNFIIFILFNPVNKIINLDLLIENLNLYFHNYKIIYINKFQPVCKYPIKWFQSDVEYIDWKYDNINWHSAIYNNI